MMNKRFVFLMGFVFLFVLVGCGGRPGSFAGRDGAETAVPEEETAGQEVTPQPTTQRGVTILADGLIKAELPSSPLGFTTNGKLLQLHVQAGDLVAEGDLIATLDDVTLNDNIANAQLQLAQAESSLAQTQADLDKLRDWEPDALAVELAQANLEAAQASLDNAQTQDAVSGNNATSAKISLDQAERNLADAQAAVTTAYDPGREWEFGVDWLRKPLEDERKAADRNLKFAEEQLAVARANYSLALGGITNNTAVSAEASVVSAQQALDQAQQGPKVEEIEAAERSVEQAEISLQQSQLSLEQAERALNDAQLFAPWAGTILTIDAAPGTFVSSGTPIVTLLDTTQMLFHTTNLSERDLAQIEQGQPAKITLKAYPDDLLEGTVLRIGVEAEGEVGDAATFPVIIRLATTDLDIRPGMTGRVEMINSEE